MNDGFRQLPFLTITADASDEPHPGTGVGAVALPSKGKAAEITTLTEACIELKTVRASQVLTKPQALEFDKAQ